MTMFRCFGPRTKAASVKFYETVSVSVAFFPVLFSGILFSRFLLFLVAFGVMMMMNFLFVLFFERFLSILCSAIAAVVWQFGVTVV